MRGRRRLPPPDKPISVSGRVRGSCNFLAVILLCYALLTGDASVAMLAVAVITGLIASSGALVQLPLGKAVQQMLYAFSVTLFIGAFLLIGL